MRTITGMTIGDEEVEDAYDASDRIEERLAVIARIVAAYEADDDEAHRHLRGIEVLRLLERIGEEIGEWQIEARSLRERVGD